MFEGKQDVADYIEGLLCAAEIKAGQTPHLFTILGWLYSKNAKPIDIPNTTKQILIDLHSKNQENENNRYQQTAIAIMKKEILHAISSAPADRSQERAPRL